MRAFARLTLIAAAATTLSVLASHLAVRVLKLKVSMLQQRVFRAGEKPVGTTIFGSSTAFDGVAWKTVAGSLGDSLESWPVGGGAPLEWRVIRRQKPVADRVFVVVSPIDLDDHYLCEFRSNLIPLPEAVKDFPEGPGDGAFARRLWDQYTLSFIRVPYPTAGRADGVMMGGRRLVARLAGRKNVANSVSGRGLYQDEPSDITDRVTDWSSGRLEKELANMRSCTLGRHYFLGQKYRALVRLLHEVGEPGHVVLMVIPLSPAYWNQLLNADDRRQFEDMLTQVARECPGIKLLRNDRLPELLADGMYRDLAHMNMFGQQTSTAAFLRELAGAGPDP